MRHVGSLQCPIIIGRDDLLDLAGRRLEEAASGRGQLILLAGEAGIGKTRLMDAIRRKAAGAGFGNATGALSPQDRQLPSALILDLARSVRHVPAFGDLGADLLAMRVDEGRDALGARRLFVLDVVDRIAEALDRPVLLDFEDLQWADEVSLEILGELARRCRDLPVLLVAAYRTDDLPPGSMLREWRSRLTAQRLAEEARLSALTYDQTALMTTIILDTGLPAPREVVEAVHQRTDGIPLHIEELLGALGDDARGDGRAILDADVPDTIEDAILVRIAQLSPEARQVAQAGAVIGRRFVPEVLAGIMDRPVSDLDEPLAELHDRSFLQDAGRSGLIDFRHQALRDVLYRSVPAGELRRLHARAGEFGSVLEGHSESHASLHFERAGLRSQAFRTALEGARKANRMSSWREAYELSQRAIDNMPEDLPAGEQAELYQAHSDAAGAVEENDQSGTMAQLARERYLAAGRPVQAAHVLINVESFLRRQVRPVVERIAVTNLALAELDALPPGPDRDAARSIFLFLRGRNALAIGDLDDAERDGNAARALAAAVESPDNVIAADGLLAEIAAVRGDVVEGVARALRAARDSRDNGFWDVGLGAFRDAALVATRVMDYRSADVATLEGVRYADAVEQTHCRHVMRANAALVNWTAGRWEPALAGAEQELVERGCRRGFLVAQDALAFAALGRGQGAKARSLLDASLEAGQASGELERILPALWGLAELDVMEGHAERALERCHAALDVATATGERALLIPFVVTGVRAGLLARRVDLAEAWSDRVGPTLAGWDGLARPAMDHASGLLRLAANSVAAARDRLDSAVRGWERLGRAWESAWARLDLAQALMRANRYGEAATALGTVRSWAEAVDSQPLLARADELARIGRGRGNVDEPWRPLTAREFEVARLISQGLTNGEIADQLAISPKTASSHVEHILAKLGVTRRAEIASWTATVLRPSEPARITNTRDGAAASLR